MDSEETTEGGKGVFDRGKDSGLRRHPLVYGCTLLSM